MDCYGLHLIKMDTDIEFIDNKTNKTLVSFTGISHGFGFDGWKQEFRGLLKQLEFNVMFVADREVSWYNTIDVDKIKSKLTNQEVITIGNSMGGYNAIQFANDFNVTKAIAFVPQYSVHPDVAPDEKRWQSLIKEIKQWRFKHLIFNNTTEYYVFSSNNLIEMYQTNMIPCQQNIHKFIIEGYHNLSCQLKTRGILYPLIYDCINKTPQIVAQKYARDIEYFGYK